ncbi:Hypothetical protein CINCED_3A005766 [Cinara cedri]|uniref:Reverse transcriptase domain n=1 Tax=Cinara cedri TaxID=506608 RepID=A0A5E4NPJ6_9HEMI|nr:Hypothetical protein CINCED_3A005766 [Cinara cedri]
MYKSITSPDDIKLLQSDLATFNEWCISNSLSLNIDKCQIVTYSKKHTPLHFNYHIFRSLLEYAPIIWNHNNVGHNDQLDKVQNKALRFLCHTCNIQRTPHSGYDNILKLLNLESLNARRHLSYSTFLTKLLNNEIDDSFILSQLNFKVNSHHTRNNHLFYIPHSSKKFTSYDPINILMSSGNS